MLWCRFTAQGGDRFLPAQTLQHDADHLFRSILLAGGAADILDGRLRRGFRWPGFLSEDC
jgi:hypothetical protein